MIDLQRLMDAMADAMRRTRSNYHLTLGRAIHDLDAVPKSHIVRFDWNEASPAEPLSYRGYYSDLAFDWRDEPTTVGEFLDALRSALGSTFTGYKGGDFIMDDQTPLWAANYGNTGRAIVGFEVTSDAVVLTTKHEEF